MKIIRNFDLSGLSYIGIGPVIERLYVISTKADIAALPENTKILGNASNILFTKNSLNINFCRLSTDDSVRVMDLSNTVVKIPGSMSIKTAVNALAERDICGLESLYPIPGTIGGMLKMNAGAENMHISDNVSEIHTDRGVLRKKDAGFSYRHSEIEGIILHAVFNLDRDDCRNIRNRINEKMEKRRDMQPMFSKSLGSVYKNPPGKKAWEIIARAGFRGKCQKGICVSEKHANFFINKNGGTAEDFLELAKQIEKKVYDDFGIKLEKEIEVL